MSDETLIKEAMVAATSTKFLLIGAESLPQAHQVFSQAFANASAAIVADSNTFRIARNVIDSLKGAGIRCVAPFVFSDPDLYAEHKYVVELRESLARHDAIPVAVGSGSINDIVKLAAHRTNRQYMSIATAASMDGYTAFGASITHEGSKQSFDCPAPCAVLADIDVIASAPAGMNAWGYADLLAKATAGADWIIADELGVEPIDPGAWRMVQDRLRAWTGDPDGVRRGDRAAIENLVRGLMMSGFAMQATKSSRPASGAEHQFSHLWDMQHATDASHGAKVGLAMVAVARLYEAISHRAVHAIDVEGIVDDWPSIEQVECKIDELFQRDTGLSSLRGAGHGPEAHVTGKALAEKGKLETGAKHPTRRQLREQLTLLRARWPRLQERIREHLLPANELAQMLSRAGSPTEPEQIGISRDRLRQSFKLAYYIRRRFTVLDLAVRSGTLDACLDEMFG